MLNDDTPHPPGGGRPLAGMRLWLLPMVALLGAAIAGVVTLIVRSDPPRTVSEVRGDIAAVVLRKSTLPNGDDGGLIGPWWVAVAEGDAATGVFRDFQMQSGSLQLAARRARLVIDPDAPSFRFELEGVVLVSVPAGLFDDVAAGGIAEIERFTLGPVPLRGRVVPDPAIPPMEVVRASPTR